MPEAPLYWLVVADCLCVAGIAFGLFAVQRHPVTCFVLAMPLLALSAITWVITMVSAFWQAAAGDHQAGGLTIALILIYVTITGVVSSSGALALRNRGAIEWWLNQQMARYSHPRHGDPGPPLEQLLDTAPPRARVPGEGWSLVFAATGAFALAAPWLFA